MTRKPLWASGAFNDFLLARASVPFAWGGNDCALFAADAIEAITGTDIAADFRGKYSDEASALSIIYRVTRGSTVADAAAWCAEKAGIAELVHPLMAQRGDLVVLEDAGRLIAGVVHLNGRHVACVGETGLQRLPISAVKRAWHY